MNFCFLNSILKHSGVVVHFCFGGTPPLPSPPLRSRPQKSHLVTPSFVSFLIFRRPKGGAKIFGGTGSPSTEPLVKQIKMAHTEKSFDAFTAHNSAQNPAVGKSDQVEKTNCAHEFVLPQNNGFLCSVLTFCAIP